MWALELNSIILTRLSWRTITVNLLTHRHAITRTWAVMYPCTFKFNVWHLNTCDHPIEIYISAFHLRHLCIPTRLVKATHNIKTSLIKQCLYMICMKLGILILLILIFWYCWYCCWCMLYTICSILCAWPVYVSLLYHAIKSCCYWIKFP
jgi:hypothetical protein